MIHSLFRNSKNQSFLFAEKGIWKKEVINGTRISKMV
jgi:hypothetical protein